MPRMPRTPTAGPARAAGRFHRLALAWIFGLIALAAGTGRAVLTAADAPHDAHGPNDGHGSHDAHGPHTHDGAGAAGPQSPAAAWLPAEAPWSPALDFTALDQLAVQDGGRKKPFDTVALESIAKITGKALFSGNPNFKDPATGQSVSAIDLYLALWLDMRDMNRLPFVLVGSMSFRQELGLNTNAERKLFALTELGQEPGWTKLTTLFDQARAKQMVKEPLTAFEKEALDLGDRLSLIQAIQGGGTMTIVPHPTDPLGQWTTLGAAPYAPAQINPARAALMQMRQGYRERNNAAFVGGANAFREALQELSPAVYPAASDLAREVHYNHLHPFRYAWLMYLAAALFSLAIMKSNNKAAYAAAVAVFTGAVLMQSYGIYLRCMIAGRPPVTNMYESVVWVGMGCAFFGLVFELIYRPKVYMVAAGLMAVLTLIVADMVPVISDAGKSIGPLAPVLRDNFWLTVHVLTITLSYAAFTLAWALGHITLFKHLVQPAATAEHKTLHNFLYKVVILGVLLLAIGTILGGVWANYSWGRFWGWDPKETWALIALLCYLFVLHGRFTGLWGLFGLSIGSVVCYLSVLMAWYGVNFILGTGLHSYGFGAGGVGGVAIFCSVDLAFVGAVILRRMMLPPPAAAAAAGATAAAPTPDPDNTAWHTQ